MEHRRLLFLFASIFLLSACGGGSGTSSDTNGTERTETYLFYASGLSAVDPANPASPITVETAGSLIPLSFGYAPLEIFASSYDPARKVATDMHTHAVIYAHSDGNLYKVSALKSGSLTPVRISSENQADQICSNVSPGKTIQDYANVDNSRFIYVLPGTDGLCATEDDAWKMVSLGMSETDDPIEIMPNMIDLFDVGSGAIAGWLYHDSFAGELVRCDAASSNCATVANASTEVVLLSQAGKYALLHFDDTLYVYDVDTGTLSSAIMSVPAGSYFDISVTDDTTTYIAVGSSIYQFPIDGSSTATELVAESSDINAIIQNADTLVYQLGITDADEGTDIKSIAKSGGSPVTLVSATGTDNTSLLLVKDKRVYYNLLNPTSINGVSTMVPVAAGLVDIDGMNKTQTPDAAWVGLILNNTLNVDSGIIIGNLVDRLILAEGYGATGAAGGYAGASLKAVNAATASTTATLGTLPSTEAVGYLECYSLSDDTLCTVEVALDPPPPSPTWPYQSDIYYLDAGAANSLVRVTHTPNEREETL